MASLQAVRQGL